MQFIVSQYSLVLSGDFCPDNFRSLSGTKITPKKMMMMITIKLQQKLMNNPTAADNLTHIKASVPSGNVQ